MSLYLYGVILHDSKVDFGASGFEGKSVAAIPHGNLAAVVGSVPSEDFFKAPKERLVGLLLAHQKTLETIMQRFFVLPFKFGTVAGDEGEVARILGEKRDFFIKLIEELKGCAEIDVVATWDVRKMLQEISEEDPEIQACKEEMAKGKADKAFVGMLLANDLKQRAQAWRKKITETLQAAAEASSEHDLLNDEMVLNTSFLIRAEKEKEFYRGMEELDRSFQGRLHFKCVGPLPPYSFATVSLKRFDPQRIREAARVLQLNGKADLSCVKKIYKELSRTIHPDTNPGQSGAEFEQLNRAYELIADYCREGKRSLEADEVKNYVRLDMSVPQGAS